MKHIENFENWLNENAKDSLLERAKNLWYPASDKNELAYFEMALEDISAFMLSLKTMNFKELYITLKKVHRLIDHNPKFMKYKAAFSNLVEIITGEWGEKEWGESDVIDIDIKPTHVDIEHRKKHLQQTIQDAKDVLRSEEYTNDFDENDIRDIIYAMEQEIEHLNKTGDPKFIGSGERVGSSFTPGARFKVGSTWPYHGWNRKDLLIKNNSKQIKGHAIIIEGDIKANPRLEKWINDNTIKFNLAKTKIQDIVKLDPIQDIVKLDPKKGIQYHPALTHYFAVFMTKSYDFDQNQDLKMKELLKLMNVKVVNAKDITEKDMYYLHRNGTSSYYKISPEFSINLPSYEELKSNDIDI